MHIYRRRLCTVTLWSVDVLSFWLIWQCTAHVRVLLNPLTTRQLSWEQSSHWAPSMAVVLLLWIAVSRRLRLYCIPNEIRPATIARWSAENTVAICTVTVLATFFSRQLGAGASRMFVVCLAPVTFAVFASTRCAALGIIALLQRRGQLPRIAVVGDPKHVNSLIKSLESRIAKTIRGVITPETTLPAEAVGLSVPVLGTTKHVAELVNREQINYAIIIRRSLPDAEAEHCKTVFWRMGLPVSYVLDVPRELNWARDGLRLVPATGIVEATWAIGHRTSANSVSENSRSYNESI